MDEAEAARAEEARSGTGADLGLRQRDDAHVARRADIDEASSSSKRVESPLARNSGLVQERALTTRVEEALFLSSRVEVRAPIAKAPPRLGGNRNAYGGYLVPTDEDLARAPVRKPKFRGPKFRGELMLFRRRFLDARRGETEKLRLVQE